MKLPRPLLVLAAIAAGVLLVIVSSLLLLPRLIDSQVIKDKISSEFLKKTAASVSFAKIAILWFPRPTVVIENAKVSFDDRTEASIQTTKIYPSIFYLFMGRLVVRRARLQEPKITVRLPLNTTGPIDVEELEKQIRSALVRFTTDLPVPRVDLSDGSAEIRIGGLPPVILENIAAQAVASPVELRFDLSARSNIFERLSFEGRISPQNLASRLDIGVRRLKINEFLALLPLQISEYVRRGEVNLDMKIASVGVRQLKASMGGSTGPIVFDRYGSAATVEVKRFKGGIAYEGGALQVDIEQLDLGSPRLKAAGQFINHSGSLSASVTVRDLNVAEVGAVVLRMVGETEGVKRILHYVPAGTITEISIQSGGRSFAEMASSHNVVVSALLRDGKIFIPDPDLQLTNVSGSVRMAGNILDAKDITANLGTTKGWNGTLRLGLEGKAAPFHLDMLVHTGAPQLQSVLLQLVTDEIFRGELLQLRNVKGELSGRLILGETMDAIAAVVAISKTNVSATYDPVPFPIEIRAGRINYAHNIIRLENAHGSVGRSTFGGLALTLHQDGSRQIKVDSGQASLDLQQTDTLLRSFKDWRPYFTKFQAARGQIELQKLTLTGAYDEPAGWNFAGTGSFNQVEIRHADFPDRITLSRGKFDVNQGRLIFSDTAVALSDAFLIADGTFQYQRGIPIQFETSGMGTIGGHMTQWLSRYVELPDEFNLRSPLQMVARRLAWRAGGDISFQGQVNVAGGPQLSLDAVKRPQGLALQDITINDGDRRAQMTLQLAKDNLDFSFRGELTQQTIDKIFTSFPMKGSSIRGDIKVNVALAGPIRVSARGQLSGSNLLIPLGTDKVLIEKVGIEAGGESIVIRSAELRWGKSYLTASGTVTGAKEILGVDLDVTGDQLDWQQLQRAFGDESKQPQQKTAGAMSIPDVAGTIRLKTDSFTFEGYRVTPLETTTAISPSRIRTEINRAVVCGINTMGRIDFADKEISLDLHLSAQEAELEPTTICLTNQQSDIKGTYSLTARITGHGHWEQLRSALKGDFQFGARDGEFVRSGGIDATFDYLNGTGDFAVNFPDLNKQTFPYRMISARGRIDGGGFFNDEIIIQASPLTVTGQGSVDMQRKQVDLKGLVSVALPAQQVIKRIPIIGAVVGGSLVGIPIRVYGSWERPEVSYLSPGDFGTELLNLPMRILGTPLEALRLFTPSGESRDQNITR